MGWLLDFLASLQQLDLPKNISGTNDLAYFASLSERKKKKFFNTDFRSIELIII
jgi:hypothetical protein